MAIFTTVFFEKYLGLSAGFCKKGLTKGRRSNPRRNFKIMIYTISKGFIQGTDQEVNDQATKANTKMANNPHFTPLDPIFATLAPANALFKQTMDAMDNGGKQATAERDQARAALIVILRALISYVEKVAQGDPIIMLSAGFDIISSEHSPATLTVPVIQGIDFGNKGAVIIHAGSMGNALLLKVRYRIPGGPWIDGVTSSQARNIVQDGLTSGQTYEFALQAFGTNNQVSDWSDYVSHMAP
jgi:hypothetical protein